MRVPIEIGLPGRTSSDAIAIPVAEDEEAGDGARTAGPAQLTLQGGAQAEVLLFDLP